MLEELLSNKIYELCNEFRKTSISSMDSVAKFEKSVKSQFIFCPTREKCYLPVHDVRWDLNPLSKFDASGIEVCICFHTITH